jgi:hypothetical protein
MESLKNETTQYYLMKLLEELHLLKVILNLMNFSVNLQVERRKTFKELFQEQEKEEKTQSKKIEFTEMSFEDEFFDKLEPIASLVQEKPSSVKLKKS